MILDSIGQPLELGDFAATAGPGRHLILGVIVELIPQSNLIKIRYLGVGRRWAYQRGDNDTNYVKSTNKRSIVVDRRSVMKFYPSGQTEFQLMHPYWIREPINAEFRTTTEATISKFLYDLQAEMKQKLNEQNQKANT